MIKNNLGGLGQNSREELSKPVGRKKNSIPKKVCPNKKRDKISLRETIMERGPKDNKFICT